MRVFDPSHIALFIPSLAGGGVARVTLLLANALARHGHRVDLVLCRVAGPYLDQVPARVKVVELQPSPGWRGRLCALSADPQAFSSLLLPVGLPFRPPQTVRYLPDLVGYLRREKPVALLAAKTPANLAAVLARRLADVPTRIVISERTHLSQEVQGPRRRKWRWRFIIPAIQQVYPWADALVTVSNGVADDLSQCTGIPRDRITTIYNPIVSPELIDKARAHLDHSWFQRGNPPVLLGAGRLTPQKDFPTLLRAFARLRAERCVRLLILGEGQQRAELETLASALGVAQDVALPGFVENPYAYMERAAVFVLSSAWEGLPGVLIQALACGCPVVSTDCPSGPAEILAGGIYGKLVPVGDAAALAKALASTLDAPPQPEQLRARGMLFSVNHAVERYLEILLGGKNVSS